MVYPISGSTGRIAKRELDGLMDSLSVQGILSLDLKQVLIHVSAMQAIFNDSGLSSIALYSLYEKMILILLKKGLLQ